MLKTVMLLCFVLFLLAFALPAGAQMETVSMFGLKARHLSGTVTTVMGKPVPGEVIEDCDSTFTHVYSSTKSDAQGRFSFAHARFGSTHYLRMGEFELNRAAVFNPMHLKVRIRLFARAKLQIRLRLES
jgi:hypothetical protein